MKRKEVIEEEQRVEGKDRKEEEEQDRGTSKKAEKDRVGRQQGKKMGWVESHRGGWW